VFITRATRHDKDDVREFLMGNDWDTDKVDLGTALIARDGRVVGCVRLVEVEPRTVVLEDLVVDGDRRRQGMGKQLVRAALNSKGGTVYLCCHDDTEGFYRSLGFTSLDFRDLPQSVKEYMKDCEEQDDPASGHRHIYMRAR
jgi:N-acetylglutamate synthase-like GNAT family acetyltransferase